MSDFCVQGEGAERVKVSVRTMVQHQANSHGHGDRKDSEQVGSTPLLLPFHRLLVSFTRCAVAG